MMRDEEQFNRESVHITFQAAILIDSRDDYQKKLDAGRRVEVFWKKGHELAWTILNTMNNIHHCHTLHNDVSPDNVMLHFPLNSKNKVFSGICDWTMAGNFNDFKESFYIHESQEARTRIMQHRWWVAPKLNYFLPPRGSTRNVEIEWWPKFTPKSKTFVVGKIIQRIYGGNLFLEYYNKYHKEERRDDVFSFSAMDQVFQHSLE
jgi:serine/threonine protein kinase